VAFGGAGVVDITFIAPVLAVALAEVIGETRERLQGGPGGEGRSPSLLKNLKAPLKPFLGGKEDKGSDG